MNHPDYQRIEQAIHFLEEHAGRQPSLEDVAAHIGLSPYHFQRLFSAWAGISPKRFLQYLTVEHAKQRLRASASVLDAALDVGLSGPGRLHDLFVGVEAMTPGEYKARGRELVLEYGFHPSPFGECLIAITARGICSLAFVGPQEREAAVADLAAAWQEATLVENPRASREIVERIFTGGRETGSLRVLLKGTNFQLKVWEALLRIPEGAVVSYGDLAAAMGQPDAQRAVGTAVGRNPIAYLIPCHRVLRNSGEIGGYRWGTPRKRAILALEAARQEQAGASDARSLR